jgi:hypothetical protein
VRDIALQLKRRGCMTGKKFVRSNPGYCSEAEHLARGMAGRAR